MLKKEEVSAHIRQIEIYTRRLLSSSLSGDSRSAMRGVGFDFDQIREYQQGDDIRFIDWRGSARSTSLLVKEYIEERSRTIIICLDVSSSGFFASKDVLRKKMMGSIASILALIADYGNDHVGLLLFSDIVELFIPPSRGGVHIKTMMHKIFLHKPESKKTSIAVALRHLVSLKNNKALVFFISDFIDTDYEKMLKLAAHKYELIAIRCLDHYEEKLPFVGFITLEDPENGQTCVINTKDYVLNSFLGKRIVTQNSLFRRIGIDYVDIKSNKQFMGELIRFFRRRMCY